MCYDELNFGFVMSTISQVVLLLLLKLEGQVDIWCSGSSRTVLGLMMLDCIDFLVCGSLYL